ncbi:carbon starvation CstA family protein [Ignatzschineria larvae DSM 13226]|uniref:Carbon starvation CstA family protein n=1 Tax=Ignatzschineria larvae DSM 13226 TaxID=1111732 RepID=A0ABZ3BZK1_9GAMM|nr:carbon starvation CstA family protein [Ignatzschineria larvae]
MFTFLGGIVLLIVGYFTYGKFVERVFGVSKRPTPAYTKGDGVDYVPMTNRKNSLIQLLNIAGVGPIFGPILGALYGPVAFIWIVFGCILAGGVHDYLTGMISIRNRGAHLPELTEKFLGKSMRHIVNAFALVLLVLVGTVFITAPSTLLYDLMGGHVSIVIIIIAIFIYNILATLLPIDKIIGKFYPFFGILLVLSAIGIGVSLLFSGKVGNIPELTLENLNPRGTAIFPLLFLVISCGALSGFHATQSPIISRTAQNEGHGRLIFYGMMIAEGIIAMIWAGAGMAMFYEPGTPYGTGLSAILTQAGEDPAVVVSKIATMLLGSVGGTIVVLGVIILPITSGATAFRSARMIVADYLKMGQEKMSHRLVIAIPLFLIAVVLLQLNFDILWRYFSWANQSTAVIALFVGAIYLYIGGRNYWISLLPGVFMLMVTTTYILEQPIGFNLPSTTSQIGAAIITVILVALFFWQAKRQKARGIPLAEDLTGWDGTSDDKGYDFTCKGL